MITQKQKRSRIMIILSVVFIFFTGAQQVHAWMIGTWTYDATDVSFNAATLNGFLLWSHPGNPIQTFFRYGVESGNYTNICTVGTNIAGDVSCVATGLEPNTTYYYSLDVEYAGSYYGSSDERSFTTNSAPVGGFDTTATSNLNISVSENLTLDCGNSIDLDNGIFLTAGTPVFNITTCHVTTNDQDGYTLSLTNDRGTNNTLYHETQSTTQDGQIQDKTPWNSITPNATNWTDTGLGFGILSSTATKDESWWGTANDCNDTDQLYAGIPTTDTSIMQHDIYSNTQTDTIICYKLDIPSTQISGEYTGSVTYTAVGRP